MPNIPTGLSATLQPVKDLLPDGLIAYLKGLGTRPFPPFLSPNIVRDGGFEKAPEAGGLGSPGSAWTPSLEARSSKRPPHSGARCALLNSSASGPTTSWNDGTPDGVPAVEGWVTQVLATTPGQAYRLSFFVAVDPGPTSLKVTVDGKTVHASNPGAIGWVSYGGANDPGGPLAFVAQSGGSALRFEAIAPVNTGVYLDDVSVSPVPPPASKALVGAGLGLAGLGLGLAAAGAVAARKAPRP